MQYLLERLTEASTWRGLIMAAGGAFGFTLAPEVNEAVIVIAVAVFGSGILGALTKDKS